MAKLLKVLVHGITGKMGKEVLSAVNKQSDMKIVAGVSQTVLQTNLENSNQHQIPVSTNLEEMIKVYEPDVIVDFTNAKAALQASRIAASAGINIVIGSTGFTKENLTEIEGLAKTNNVSIFIASNFAIGAILIMQMSKLVGKFFDYADIVEMHHEAKIDSPSGTALSIASKLLEGKDSGFIKTTSEKETVEGTRGGEIDGVTIHSVRMPGRMAHHQVILGTQGQTLTLSHDTISRECYMPGVLLAIREVVKRKGVMVGLEKLLDM
tara:strand:+ start:359 stop:1156 length:798 start_codon:yes stop_codon:yes gene_type:complete